MRLEEEWNWMSVLGAGGMSTFVLLSSVRGVGTQEYFLLYKGMHGGRVEENHFSSFYKKKSKK